MPAPRNALSWGVVQVRLSREVSLDTAGHDDLTVAQRRQGNFIEHVPMALVLLGLVELAGTAPWLVQTLSATLLVARILHPFGLAVEFGLRPPRFSGAAATWIVIVAESALLLWAQLG